MNKEFDAKTWGHNSLTGRLRIVQEHGVDKEWNYNLDLFYNIKEFHWKGFVNEYKKLTSKCIDWNKITQEYMGGTDGNIQIDEDDINFMKTWVKESLEYI